MKAILLVLVLAATGDAQRGDCTALAATQGAMVTLEKSSAPLPSPKPAPGGAQVGGPLDMYHDARALIDKGNALADRGKTLLDQAQRDGKITVDIRLPSAAISQAPLAGLTEETCRRGHCPGPTRQTTPPADLPQTPSQPGGDCPGGVCPSCPRPDQRSAAFAGPAAQGSGGNCPLRRLWRSRR